MMKSYIGVKMIKAVQATVRQAIEAGASVPDSTQEKGMEQPGYLVKYTDSYMAWSPADVFEAAYFPLRDPSRITLDDVNLMMGPLGGHKISPKSTLVEAVNSLIGFETFNVSSCVDPENYDTSVGIKCGGEKIRSEFWNCLGFVLQWAKHGLVYREGSCRDQCSNDPNPGMTEKKIEEIAMVAHEINRAYCASIGDLSQPSWDTAPDWQKSSAMNGVIFHLNNPMADPEASHESWLAEKKADGWTYGEVKDPEKKEHPCFVPYNELSQEQRSKDYLFRGVVHAMLAILN